MLTDEELRQELQQICENCGEFKGRHKAGILNCPILSDYGTTAAYQGNQFFKKWEDEPCSTTTQTGK